MKLKRLQEHKNDFALTNLTLGKVESIRNALQMQKNLDYLGPVANDVLIQLNMILENPIDPFGNSHMK